MRTENPENPAREEDGEKLRGRNPIEVGRREQAPDRPDCVEPENERENPELHADGPGRVVGQGLRRRSRDEPFRLDRDESGVVFARPVRPAVEERLLERRSRLRRVADDDPARSRRFRQSLAHLFCRPSSAHTRPWAACRKNERAAEEPPSAASLMDGAALSVRAAAG